MSEGEESAAAQLAVLRAQLANGSASDGFHTFTELYAFRTVLNAYAAHDWLARGWSVVKSWRHHTGEECFGGGWFIITVATPKGQASFHYPASEWPLFDVPEAELADPWDGHDAATALARLREALAREATCGAFASEFQRRNAARTGDPGCPLPAGHEEPGHVLSKVALAAIDAGAVRLDADEE